MTKSAVFELSPSAVATIRAETKPQILAELAGLFARSYALDKESVLEGLIEREKLGSTGFGHNVAIPHARHAGVAGPVTAVLRLERPIDFESADTMPVSLILGLLSPPTCGASHLHALAAVSRLIRADDTRQAMLDATDPAVLFSLISAANEAHVG